MLPQRIFALGFRGVVELHARVVPGGSRAVDRDVTRVVGGDVIVGGLAEPDAMKFPNSLPHPPLT